MMCGLMDFSPLFVFSKLPGICSDTDLFESYFQKSLP
jgi:hypothetical protein